MFDSYTLEQFEGPLDFLWQLLLKEELKIEAVDLRAILCQYLEKQSPLEAKAEFTYWMAHLLWMKTQGLLPNEEESNGFEALLSSPEQTLHHLIEYCRLKEAAKALFKLEEGQDGICGRGMIENEPFPKKSGVEHLTLGDLAKLFEQVAKRAHTAPQTIYEEAFRVSDKVDYIREMLTSKGKIAFDALFPGDLSKEELIVTFLALLEMMKLSILSVIRHQEEGNVEIVFRIPT